MPTDEWGCPLTPRWRFTGNTRVQSEEIDDTTGDVRWVAVPMRGYQQGHSQDEYLRNMQGIGGGVPQSIYHCYPGPLSAAQNIPSQIGNAIRQQFGEQNANNNIAHYLNRGQNNGIV